MDLAQTYQELCDEAAEAQGKKEEAFLDLPRPLYVRPVRSGIGPDVLQLTPFHHLMMIGLGLKFADGGEWTRRDVRMAAWIMSPGYRIGSRWRCLIWQMRHWRLDYPAAVDGIRAAFDAAFALAPCGSGASIKDDSKPWHVVNQQLLIAQLVAALHPWPEQVVFHTPYARLFQYLQAMRPQTSNGVQSPPSSRMDSRWLTAKREARKVGA